MSLLRDAIGRGCQKLLKVLIELKAEVIKPSLSGHTPIINAYVTCNVKILDWVIQPMQILTLTIIVGELPTTLLQSMMTMGF